MNATTLLETIFAYVAQVSSKRDFEEVLTVLADMGKALCAADRCSVWVVNEDQKRITTKVAHGIDTITMSVDTGIVGDAIQNNASYIIDDVYADPRFNQEIDQQTGYRTRSMMVIPMSDHDGKIIGAFQAINKLGEEGVFNERDLSLLTLATTYAAESIVSAQLTDEIEETQKEIIFTMGAIAECRSKETSNHIKRVAEFSKQLALLYGLDSKEAELLKLASPMHDVGKVAIPDAILNKKGRFNAEERFIMDSHAQLGYEMLKNSQRTILQAAAIVAHEHHEKWDGSGYPRGLSGEDIHIFGRITAVADVFDALSCHRVYKRAWERERIVAYFEAERGKHFDPHLTDLFLTHLDRFYEIREAFQDTFGDQAQPDMPQNHVEVLGAYGTKARGFGASAFWLNKRTTIDAGNLLEGLDEEAAFVTDIYVTHAHLDHIVDIAYVMDNYFALRTEPLVLHGTKETLEAIQTHFLNDILWPDFSKIKLPDQEKMAIEYREITIGETYPIAPNESIRAFATDHTAGSCGYVYTKQGRSLLITSDTYDLTSTIATIEEDETITTVIVECSFPDKLIPLAIESKHLTPSLLFSQLERLSRKEIHLYINHIKPIHVLQVTKEIQQTSTPFRVTVLKDGDIIVL